MKLFRFGFLVVVLLSSLIPLSGKADQQGDFAYTNYGASIRITGYLGAGGAVIVPSVITNLPVTSIAPSTFAGQASLTSVAIPGSVSVIESNAFQNCMALTSVTLSNGVTSIGPGAFNGCSSLISAAIPGSVTDIGTNAFRNCTTLIGVTIPTGVVNIWNGAFYGCSSLVSITLPRTSIRNIGADAFRNCTTLISVTLAGTNIGTGAFYGCSSLTGVTIPVTIGGISNDLFHNCTSLANINIVGGIGSIGSSAFYGCSKLSSITLPGSVTNIMNDAFNGCSSLASANLTAGLLSVGNNAFYGCSKLASVEIPSTVLSIGNNAFQNCSSLASVSLSSSLTNIGNATFYGCSKLSSVSIPTNVMAIGNDAFHYCSSLTSVSMPDGVTSIGSSAFYGCTKLQQAVIPAGVTSLANQVFGECSTLNNVTIPAGITSIGIEAFYKCAGMATLTIQGNVSSIGDYAFAICPNLRSVCFDHDAPATVADTVFFQTTRPTVYYHNGTAGWTSTFGGLPTDTCVACSDLIDSVLPVASFTSPASGIALLSTTVSFGGVASDNAGVTNVWYRVNSGSWLSAPTTNGWTNWYGAVTCPQGSNTLSVYCADSSGNLSLTNQVQFLVDTIHPGITIDSPRNNQALSNLVVTVGGSASDTMGISNVWYRINQQAWAVASTTNGWTNWFGTNSVPVGRNTLQAYCEDNSGNFSFTNSVGFVIDTNVPLIAINWPRTNSVQTNMLMTINGYVADNVAVSNVWFRLNQGPWSTAAISNGANGVFVWYGTTTVTQKANVVQAYAVDTAGNVSATNQVKFSCLQATPLIVLTNGRGRVSPNWTTTNLFTGRSYKLQAVPSANWLFLNWSGSTNSTSSALNFVMQSGLSFTANFVTNQFIAAQGNYNGLFAPTNGVRRQTNSGAFALSVTSGGKITGTLFLGTERISLTGAFDPTGSALLQSTRLGKNSLTTSLKLDFAEHQVNGTVTDGAFNASIQGDQAVFSATNPAQKFAGQYTMVLPGAEDPLVGPHGASFGTVKVDSSGNLMLGLNLADGSSYGGSTVISADGFWPLYAPLYNGKGSLWCWGLITNREIMASSDLSWINATNSSASALYRRGFTNETVAIASSAFSPNVTPLFGAANALVVLSGGNLPYAITNPVVLKANNTFTNAPGYTNRLSGTIKTDGTLSGTFANPAKPSKMIPFYGAVLQNQTNAAGWFAGTNQTGMMLMELPGGE